MRGHGRKLDRHGAGKIYFVQVGTTGPIKIGYSKRPIKERIAGLQAGHHDELVFLGAFTGSYTDEQNLHYFYSELRIRGEWFQPHRDLVRLIISTSKEPPFPTIPPLPNLTLTTPVPPVPTPAPTPAPVTAPPKKKRPAKIPATSFVIRPSPTMSEIAEDLQRERLMKIKRSLLIEAVASSSTVSEVATKLKIQHHEAQAEMQKYGVWLNNFSRRRRVRQVDSIIRRK